MCVRVCMSMVAIDEEHNTKKSCLFEKREREKKNTHTNSQRKRKDMYSKVKHITHKHIQSSFRTCNMVALYCYTQEPQPNIKRAYFK